MKKNGQLDLINRILEFAVPYKKFLILALLSAVAGVGLSLFAPVLIGDGIDLIIGPGEVYFDEIAKILLLLGAVILSSALFQWLMTYCTNQLTYYTIHDIRKSAFEKLHEVPLKYVDKNSHGDIMHRVVNDMDQISDGLLQGFAQLFSGIITIVGTLIFMLTINIKITLLVVVLTPLSLFVASFITKRTFHKFREQSIIRGELSGYIEEMVGQQKIVKSFSYENRACDHFKEVNERLNRCGIKAQFYSSLTNPCTRFVNGIVYAAVGVMGAFSALSGNLSIGQLSCFLSYANQYTKPFNEISGVIAELQSALASAKRVFDLIDEPVESSDEYAVTDVKCDGNVSLENVYFSYSLDKPLIEGLNLEVRRGQRIAIVGPTGCGKTTIINLLMRFYDVDLGVIRVSNVPINNMKRKKLRSMYGMVLQDTWLFKGTVRENITYGADDAKAEDIIEAAKLAHAHSFIIRLPNGYDTILTEDGGNISQGQKQLLCIARIMLTRPPMLILDEATSNIDTRTEIKIQRAFHKLMDGRTSFVVAHRLSTIRESDVILVMQNGNVIEQGTHEGLLEKGGFYAELYNSQFAPAGAI